MNEFGLLKIIGIIITLLFVGFFAGIQVAFISANKFSFELKRKQGLRSGRVLAQLLEHCSVQIQAVRTTKNSQTWFVLCRLVERVVIRHIR